MGRTKLLSIKNTRSGPIRLTDHKMYTKARSQHQFLSSRLALKRRRSGLTTQAQMPTYHKQMKTRLTQRTINPDTGVFLPVSPTLLSHSAPAFSTNNKPEERPKETEPNSRQIQKKKKWHFILTLQCKVTSLQCTLRKVGEKRAFH